MPATLRIEQKNDDDVLSVEEGAAIVGKSRLAMYRAIRLGHIPLGIYWRIGRDIYVSRARLIAWRDAGGTAAPAEPIGAACA